jgi:hypothetical protein
MMNQAQFGAAIRSVLCGPGTTLTEILDRKGLFFWTFSQVDPNVEKVKQPTQGVWADILMESLREVKVPTETPEPHQLMWESGIYGLDRLIVLRPTRSLNVEAGRRRFDALVGSSVYGGGPPVQIRGESDRVRDGTEVRFGPPTKIDLETITPAFGGPGFGGMGGGMAGMANNNDGWLAWQEAAQKLELPSEFWDKVDFGFEARLGQVNEWTIPVPEELIKAVREALKVEPAAKAKTGSAR